MNKLKDNVAFGKDVQSLAMDFLTVAKKQLLLLTLGLEKGTR